MENSTLFGAIVAAIVLPAGFAYWITDVPAPAPKAQEVRRTAPASLQRPMTTPAPSPPSKSDNFAFSPVNPFGSPTAAPVSAPAAAPALAQPQRTSLAPRTVAAENDAGGN